MTTADALFLLVLALLPLVLTVSMFTSKQSMLGFPCMIFWMLLSGYAYTIHVSTWDIWYFLFFASAGMGIFCALAQFGLHDEERETAYNSTPESKQQKDYLGETVDYEDKQEEPGSDDPTSNRTRELRARADKRRTRSADRGSSGRQYNGEFK